MRILTDRITKEDLISSSENFIDSDAIKAVVDINKEIIAVDSPMHYECQQLLLENGSELEDLWGINLYLDSKNIDELVEFNSMINVRPAQGNRSRDVEDIQKREKIQDVVREWII